MVELSELRLKLEMGAIEERVEGVAGIVVLAECAVKEGGKGRVVLAWDGVLIEVFKDALEGLLGEESVGARESDREAGIIEATEEIEGSGMVLDVLCELDQGDLAGFGSVLLSESIPSVDLQKGENKGSLKGFGFGE